MFVVHLNHFKEVWMPWFQHYRSLTNLAQFSYDIEHDCTIYTCVWLYLACNQNVLIIIYYKLELIRIMQYSKENKIWYLEMIFVLGRNWNYLVLCFILLWGEGIQFIWMCNLAVHSLISILKNPFNNVLALKSIHMCLNVFMFPCLCFCPYCIHVCLCVWYCS